MSTLIANHNNGDLADVEFDFVRVTSLLPNRKSKPVGDAAFCIAVRDTGDKRVPGKFDSPFLNPCCRIVYRTNICTRINRTNSCCACLDLERWLTHKPIQARRAGIVIRGKKWVRRHPTTAVAVASLIVLCGIVGLVVWKSELIRPRPATGIAVLPFENLSNNKEDTSFADGVQDDILTKLAKIADLKVISRTSVMQYRANRNMRQIGDALRVSHVLEGSVRKNGSRLHINAQLIDTRTDTHIWVEQYDRELRDMFAIQSEIAQKVAEQLHAKVLPAERLAIERAPTTDLTAFALYGRARNLLLATSSDVSGRANLLQAADLLEQAVTYDQAFLEAYCQLAHTHDRLYHLGYDHTPSRLARAEAASRRHCASVLMQARLIWHVLKIFTADTSITTALSLSWKPPLAACRTIPKYSS